MAVYEVYIDKKPCFFGLNELDHDDGREDHAIKVFKTWSRSTDIKLIERTEVDFLFDLTKPLGITISPA